MMVILKLVLKWHSNLMVVYNKYGSSYSTERMFSIASWTFETQNPLSSGSIHYSNKHLLVRISRDHEISHFCLVLRTRAWCLVSEVNHYCSPAWISTCGGFIEMTLIYLNTLFPVAETLLGRFRNYGLGGGMSIRGWLQGFKYL